MRSALPEAAPEKGEKTMTAYVVALVKVTDDTWIPSYATEGAEVIARHGGRYISRSANVDVIEGADNDIDLIALIEFPDKDAVHRLFADPAYAPHGEARRGGSVTRLFLIGNTDAAGALAHLPKG